MTPPFAWKAGGGFILAAAAKAKQEAESAAARLARRREKRLRWLEATASERSLRCVTIRVVEGVALKRMDLFKKQDPYVRVTLKDAAGNSYGSGRTKTLWRGGVDPKWTDKHVSVDKGVWLQLMGGLEGRKRENRVGWARRTLREGGCIVLNDTYTFTLPGSRVRHWTFGVPSNPHPRAHAHTPVTTKSTMSISNSHLLPAVAYRCRHV